MPFEEGNQAAKNRRKPKPFADALRMELAAVGEDHRALRAVAAKLLALALEGDMAAIKELVDRTDGKVPQAVVGDSDEDPINIVTRIERHIVDPANPNS